MDVTESELAWAMRTTKIMVHDKDGLADLAGCFAAGTLVTRGKGAVWLPEEHAVMLLRKIAGDQKRRHAEEAECRAEGARCDREGGPCTCPCDPEAEAAALREPDGDVAGAHVCCEHVLDGGPASDELEAMDRIVALLRTRSDRAVKRILGWALDRLTDIGEPPF